VADLPDGVRPEIIAALVIPDSSDHAEMLFNATEVERQFAARLSGQLAEMTGHRAAVLRGVAELLGPYWPSGAKLMDAMAVAPERVRRDVLRWLDILDP
jgi:hypothetical protein